MTARRLVSILLPALLPLVIIFCSFNYKLHAKEVKSSMDELKSLGVFTVTLNGETREAYLSKKKVLYFEWHYGEKGKKGWVSYCTGYRSEESLQIVTPKGTLELPVSRIRPYLSPSYSVKYATKTIKEAPAAVQDYFRETAKPVTVEEYCLEPGKTYHAKVSTESYFLPPGEDGNPVERHNDVLMLSDSPFRDGVPGGEITPGYRGWTY